jgi:hypothetical protein
MNAVLLLKNIKKFWLALIILAALAGLAFAETVKCENKEIYLAPTLPDNAEPGWHACGNPPPKWVHANPDDYCDPRFTYHDLCNAKTHRIKWCEPGDKTYPCGPKKGAKAPAAFNPPMIEKRFDACMDAWLSEMDRNQGNFSQLSFRAKEHECIEKALKDGKPT